MQHLTLMNIKISNIHPTETIGFAIVGFGYIGRRHAEMIASNPNARLLAQSLKDIRAGDILLAHLGIWSRKDPWAPAVLEPLILGLKAKGFCFATLSQHPTYQASGRLHRTPR